MLGLTLPVLHALAGAPAGVPLLAHVGTVLSLRAEAGAGTLPPVPEADPEPTVDALLEPGITVLGSTERSSSSLALTPRLYQREPNFTGVSRPLLLGRLGASYDYLLSRRLRWLSSAGLSYGEVDYANLGLTFNTPLTTRLEDPVLTAFTAEAQSTLSWAASRRSTVDLSAMFTTYEPTDDTDVAGRPASMSTGFDASYSWELNRRSTLSLPVGYRKFWVDPGDDTELAMVGVGYSRDLDARTQIEGLAGLGVELVEGERHPFPRALLAYERLISQQRDARISNRIAASLDARFDPSAGEVRPTAALEAALRAALGRKWGVFFSLAGSTAVSSEPLFDDSLDSAVIARAGAAHRFSRNLSLDFGIDVGSRASHWNADPFRWSDERVRAFVGISALTEWNPPRQATTGASTR